MTQPVFSGAALAQFDMAYPGTPQHLTHALAGHPLLELDALLTLAARMRPETLEHNAATDLPLGIEPTVSATAHRTE